VAALLFGFYQIIFTPRHFLRKLLLIDILIGASLYFTRYIYGKVLIYIACVGHLTSNSIKDGITETLTGCTNKLPTELTVEYPTADHIIFVLATLFFCFIFLICLFIIWKKYKPQGLVQSIHKRYVRITGVVFFLCLIADLYLTYSPIPTIVVPGWQIVPWNIHTEYKVGMEQAQKQASWTLYYPDPLPQDFLQKNKAELTEGSLSLFFDRRISDNSNIYSYAYKQDQKSLKLSSGEMTENLLAYVKDKDKGNAPQKITISGFQEAYLFSRVSAYAEAKVFDTLCGQKADKTFHCITLVASPKAYDNVARAKLLVDFAESLKPFKS
jgi:hypothetical protein